MSVISWFDILFILNENKVNVDDYYNFSSNIKNIEDYKIMIKDFFDYFLIKRNIHYINSHSYNELSDIYGSSHSFSLSSVISNFTPKELQLFEKLTISTFRSLQPSEFIEIFPELKVMPKEEFDNLTLYLTKK